MSRTDKSDRLTDTRETNVRANSKTDLQDQSWQKRACWVGGEAGFPLAVGSRNYAAVHTIVLNGYKTIVSRLTCKQAYAEGVVIRKQRAVSGYVNSIPCVLYVSDCSRFCPRAERWNLINRDAVVYRAHARNTHGNSGLYAFSYPFFRLLRSPRLSTS